MKKFVLITGGAGYLGSVLAEVLLDNGYIVTVYDNLMYKQTSLLHLCDNKNFNFIKGDVTNKKQFLPQIINHDIIIPLAAIVGAPACDANQDLATAINYNQIEFIVDNLRKDQKLLMPNTNSQYGTSPRMRTDLLVNDFVYKSITEGCLVLFQSHFKRNYIHVRDIAYTFLHCIENYSKLNGEVFNVGLSNANLNKKELAETIKNYFPNLVIIENEFSTDIDNRNYIVSNDKLEATGWKPKYTIEDGINELMLAYKMVIADNNKKYTNL